MLLELFHFILVGAVGNELVDVVQGPFGRDLKAGVFLPDATIAALSIGGSVGRVGPHALGAAGPCVHLLLVEGVPFGVGVRGERLLWCRGKHSSRSYIWLHGKAVEIHLLGHEGVLVVKGSGHERIKRLVGGGRLSAGIVDHGPRLLAIGSSFVGW